MNKMDQVVLVLFIETSFITIMGAYSPHYHTAARLEFKSCLWTLGYWFGLGQSCGKTRECGQ